MKQTQINIYLLLPYDISNVGDTTKKKNVYIDIEKNDDGRKKKRSTSTFPKISKSNLSTEVKKHVFEMEDVIMNWRRKKNLTHLLI